MLLVALLGTVMFSINSLVQAAAMDLGEGKRLEGSLIGLLWGSNAAFGFFPPLILGGLVGAFGFEGHLPLRRRSLPRRRRRGHQPAPLSDSHAAGILVRGAHALMLTE